VLNLVPKMWLWHYGMAYQSGPMFFYDVDGLPGASGGLNGSTQHPGRTQLLGGLPRFACGLNISRQAFPNRVNSSSDMCCNRLRRFSRLNSQAAKVKILNGRSSHKKELRA
jgi:hypothetical protein